MRVFLAGASGAVGLQMIPLLLQAGHDIVALTRTASKAGQLRALGAEPVVCDVYDSTALRHVIERAAPEVVIDQLTSLPAKKYDPRKLAKMNEHNDRLRREATVILLDAAIAAGARRFVAQSGAFFYAPDGGMVKDEDARLYTDAPAALRASVEAAIELETNVLRSDLHPIVLRYGWFYGPGTWWAKGGYFYREVRWLRYPVVGAGTGVFSWIHVRDAAAAAVQAVSADASGVYNVVDDEPAQLREWLPEYARAVGAVRPLRVPRGIVRALAGSMVADQAVGLRGADNSRAKCDLRWEPQIPSWRDGFRTALG